MAGNAAGFSGLQLPSSSSIFHLPHLWLLLLLSLYHGSPCVCIYICVYTYSPYWFLRWNAETGGEEMEGIRGWEGGKREGREKRWGKGMERRRGVSCSRFLRAGNVRRDPFNIVETARDVCIQRVSVHTRVRARSCIGTTVKGKSNQTVRSLVFHNYPSLILLSVSITCLPGIPFFFSSFFFYSSWFQWIKFKRDNK